MDKTSKIAAAKANGIRMLTGYLIDTDEGVAKPVCIEDKLETLYLTLHCNLITITYQLIKGKEYCIIADDEGLFKPNRISALDKATFEPRLVGSILITSAEDPDGSGNFVSLSPEEIESIKASIVKFLDKKGIYQVVLLGTD